MGTHNSAFLHSADICVRLSLHLPTPLLLFHGNLPLPAVLYLPQVYEFLERRRIHTLPRQGSYSNAEPRTFYMICNEEDDG